MKKLTLSLIGLFTTLNMSSSFAHPFCTKDDLSAVGQFETAAGNNYGTFTLTNISNHPCKISGNHPLIIEHPNTVTNIKTQQANKLSQKLLTLNPKQSISASVHYPNGPQCNSPLDHPDVMFSYEAAPKLTLSFMNGTTTNPFSLTTCQAKKEITLIKISGFSFPPA